MVIKDNLYFPFDYYNKYYKIIKLMVAKLP